MNAHYTGKQIADRRKALGLTQKMLAERLHITDKAVSKWERGINFPDLGLMEDLAKALDTTPAALLGLENADQEEIVSSITQISNEQLEDLHRDVKWIGWGSIAAAALLTAAYLLFGNNVKRTQNAYLILHCVIIAIVISGIYLLVKYGQVRRFQTLDICTLYAAAISIGIILGIQFFTGYSPNTILALCCIAIAACSVQFLFYRIMEPQIAKALPAIVCTTFAAWHLWNGTSVATFLTPALCCVAVWLLCRIRKVK